MNGKIIKKNIKYVFVISVIKKFCCEILGYEGKYFIFFYYKLVMSVYFYLYCFDVQCVYLLIRCIQYYLNVFRMFSFFKLLFLNMIF